MVDSQTLEKIKDYFNLVDFIGRYVQLKKRGANYLGLCPFHSEKTGSFTVSPAKQIWHCFGCGEGGNIFNFLMAIEKISFIEAVKKLAEEAGIEVEDDYRDPATISKEKRLLQLNQKVADFFQKNLTGEPLQYLKNRGLSEQIITDFQLGYAPDSWDSLKNNFGTEKQPDLISLGLLANNGQVYDVFRKRIIFPIRDYNDRIIGFGGRALDHQDKAKYLNSPDSPLFNKRFHLFALNLAKKQIVKQGYFLLMEGYMDVISAHQHGFKTAVASLGTSLTVEQARLLRRYSKKIVIAYDNDSAGLSASQRAIDILMPLDFDIKILQIPATAKDPDDYLLKNGTDQFASLIENAVAFVKFKLDRILNSYKITLPEEKEQAIRDCVVFLKEQPAIIREEYSEYLSQRLNISKETVLSYLVTTNKYNFSAKSALSKPRNKFDEAEKILLLAGLRNLATRKLLKNLSLDLISESRRAFFSRLVNSEDEAQIFLAQLNDSPQDKQLRGLLAEISIIKEKIDDNETKAALDTISSRQNELSYQELRSKLHQAQKQGNDLEALELLQRIKTLKEELYAQN